MKEKNFNLYIVLIECCVFISLPFLSELILRKLKIGFNYYPLNPSLISHHIHPKNFEFTSYSISSYNSYSLLIKPNLSMPQVLLIYKQHLSSLNEYIEMLFYSSAINYCEEKKQRFFRKKSYQAVCITLYIFIKFRK